MVFNPEVLRLISLVQLLRLPNPKQLSSWLLVSACIRQVVRQQQFALHNNEAWQRLTDCLKNPSMILHERTEVAEKRTPNVLSPTPRFAANPPPLKPTAPPHVGRHHHHHQRYRTGKSRNTIIIAKVAAAC